ncbi:DUF2256 domain-containing protein [Algihabitans albus]|uniref:DUF2256 domain-containing protein n=1 Tax=Algihabitans albus TaxID=2164067 RepID=UPI0035CF8E55
MSPTKGNSGRSKGKAQLPQKTCASCGRPFAWRKKWERVWPEVRYCSERCRRLRGRSTSS